MAKYRIDTTNGSYIVETEDTPAGGAPPDAGAQMRASALARTGAAMDDTAASGTIQVPTNPYGGAPVVPAATRAPAGAPLASVANTINPGTGAIQMIHGAEHFTEPGLRAKVGGANDVVRGGMKVLSPALLATGVAAPLETAADLALGTGASDLLEGGLKAVGVPNEYAEAAGTAASLAVPGAGHTEVGGRVLDKVSAGVDKVTPTVSLPRSGSPVQRAAADWAVAHGAPLDAAAVTQNPVVRGAQELVSSTPGAGAYVERAIQARNDWYAQKGRELAGGGTFADGTAKPPLSEENAGRAVFDQSVKQIQDASKGAHKEYSDLEAIEKLPESSKLVQTGTETKTVPMQTGTRDVPVPGVVDANGKPATRSEPVMSNVSREVPKMENVALPVDMSEYQARFKPVLAQLERQTRLGQQQYAPAQMAVEDLVNGPRFAPASVAEKNLGALKQVLRDNTLAGGVTNEAGGLAASSIEQLEGDINKAVKAGGGAPALAALKAGRSNTASKYQAIDLVNQFKAEPVKLYKQMVAPHDGNIDFLRNVQKIAPSQTADLGRAWIDGAMDKATEAGRFDHADKLYTDWQNLGDATKKIIFKSPEHIADLDNFFQSVKDSARVENSSKTAKVAHLGATGSLLFAHPGLGASYLVAGNVLARLLYNPRFVRAATRALEAPAGSSEGAAAARSLLSVAGTAAKPSTVQPVQSAPENQAQSVPSSGGNSNEQPTTTNTNTNAGTASEGTPIPANARPVAAQNRQSARTSVRIAGQVGKGYPAEYKLQELDDVIGSHNGNTFNPDMRYTMKNDRNYGNVANQGKIVNNSTDEAFDPAFHITDNPDATNGPMVLDSDNEAVAGSGRKAILDRIYAANGKAAASYRKMLADKAAQFGQDPALVPQMRKPVLTRVLDDATDFNAANAITDMNKTGTAALTPSERAIADSQRVSNDTLDHVAGQLESGGAKATISSVLDGKPGTEILDKLVADGVIAPQEKAGLADANGLTKDGKERVSKLLVGRFFESPDQIDRVPLSIRGKIERLAAPVAATDGLSGGWNLTPYLREAVGIVDSAKKAGISNIQDFLKQDGLFGAAGKYSARAVKLADALSTSKSADIMDAARRYAEDAKYAGKGPSLMGNEPTPEDSFDDTFGKLKSGAQVDAKARLKKTVKP